VQYRIRTLPPGYSRYSACSSLTLSSGNAQVPHSSVLREESAGPQLSNISLPAPLVNDITAAVIRGHSSPHEHAAEKLLSPHGLPFRRYPAAAHK
jgi:hypothetical protein